MPILSALCIFSASLALVLAVVALRRNARSRLHIAVVVWALANAAWSTSAAFLYSAANEADFWIALRVGSVFYLLIQPLFAFIGFTLAGVRLPALAAILVPELIIVTLEIIQATTGIWTIRGYVPDPWGNIGLPSEETFWFTLGTIKGIYIRVVVLIVFVVVYRKSRSRRFRTIIVHYLVWNFVISSINQFAVSTVWLDWGLPQPAAALTFISMLFYFFLIIRYNHLEPHRPGGKGYWFPRYIKDPILLTDGSGRILWVADALANVFSRRASEIEGGSLFDVLGRPELRKVWDELSSGTSDSARAEVELQGRRATLLANVERDRFGDVGTILVRLRRHDPEEDHSARFGLTAREQELVALLAQGYSNKQIAEKLFISLATVKNHLHHIFEKTQTASRLEAVRLFASPPATNEPNDS